MKEYIDNSLPKNIVLRWEIQVVIRNNENNDELNKYFHYDSYKKCLQAFIKLKKEYKNSIVEQNKTVIMDMELVCYKKITYFSKDNWYLGLMYRERINHWSILGHKNLEISQKIEGPMASEGKDK